MLPSFENFDKFPKDFRLVVYAAEVSYFVFPDFSGYFFTFLNKFVFYCFISDVSCVGPSLG